MKDRMRQGKQMYELGLRLGSLGAVAIGSAGGSLARVLARAAGCGAALAGGDVRFHDGGCAACAAWLGRYYRMPASLFLRQQGGEIKIWVLDSQGRLFEPPAQPVPPAPCTGEWDMLVGVEQAWAAQRCAGIRRSGTVCVRGPQGLTLALERMGYVVVAPRRGVPLLRSDREGFSLSVELDGASSRLLGEDALAAAASWLPPASQIPAFHQNARLL